MTVKIVKGVEINVPDDMNVVRQGADRDDVIMYKDRQIILPEADYKPDLRPGPFFVYDDGAHMHEFDTLDECRAFIDRM
jgi:hypothetical protein